MALDIRLDLRKLDSIINAFDGRAKRLVTALGQEALTRTKQKAPVDTGTLRRSYHAEPDRSDASGLTVVVGTNLEYAPFVEFGTSKMAAQPHLQPAFEETRALAPKLAEAMFR